MNIHKNPGPVHSVKKLFNYVFISFVAALATGCASFIDNDCAMNGRKAVNVGAEEMAFEVRAEKKCNKSGIYIEQGERYKITAERTSSLIDGDDPLNWIAVDPVTHKPLDVGGFNHYQLEKIGARIALTIGQPFRPIASSDANYFEIVCSIGHIKEAFYSIYEGAKGPIDFPETADKDGELFCLVNDFPYWGRYENNQGTIEVKVKKLRRE